METATSIHEVIQEYLNSVKLSRSVNTARTYSNAMRTFSEVLDAHNLKPEIARIFLHLKFVID